MINNGKQYETTNMNKSNKREMIRALFEAYKSRMTAESGFTLETVMNDRLMAFKNITKKEIELCFFTMMFFILIAYMIFINTINLNSYFFFLVAGLFGYAISNFRIFMLKSITPLETKRHKIAFKKAIFDVYFETLTSPHIVYYMFGGVIAILIFLMINYTTIEMFYNVDVAILKVTQKFGFAFFNFQTFIIDLLSSILSYIVGSYLYLLLDIYLEIKSLIKKYKTEGFDDN